MTFLEITVQLIKIRKFYNIQFILILKSDSINGILLKLIPVCFLCVHHLHTCILYSSKRFCALQSQNSFAKSCLTPWIVARQTSLSKGFSRQGCLSGLPFPLPRGSSWVRDWNPCFLHHLCCKQILYHWATREALSGFSMGFFWSRLWNGLFPQGSLIPFSGSYTWKPSLDGEFACSWDVLFCKSFQVSLRKYSKTLVHHRKPPS